MARPSRHVIEVRAATDAEMHEHFGGHDGALVATENGELLCRMGYCLVGTTMIGSAGVCTHGPAFIRTFTVLRKLAKARGCSVIRYFVAPGEEGTIPGLNAKRFKVIATIVDFTV